MMGLMVVDVGGKNAPLRRMEGYHARKTPKPRPDEEGASCRLAQTA